MKREGSFYQKHKQVILYILFGLITTVASLGMCYVTLKVGVLFLHDENGEPTELLDVLGSTVQWITGVSVAFFTNKKWVFTEAEHGVVNTFKQLAKFSSGRVITYFLEVGLNLGLIAIFEAVGYRAFAIFGIFITTRVWAKAISSFAVVIVNYFISKLIVFKKKEDV